MDFSICIDAVFQGRDFCASLATVRELGYSNFEFWGWWNKDIAAIRKAKDELEMNVAAFCTRFISLVDASKRDEYVAGLTETLEVAKELGCSCLISQVGDELPGVSREAQHQSLVDGLKVCAPLLEKEGVTLAFEPLNTLYDHEGYYLYRSAEAYEIVDEVGSDRVKVLFDIYHQQIMEGNLIRNIEAGIDKIAHFHTAGHPGRNELDSGEIAYPEVFRAIGETSYPGLVGVEYFATQPPEEWLKTLRTWL